MAGKRNEWNGHTLFAPLTTDENLAVRAVLGAGRACAVLASGDYDFSSEMHEVHADLSEAYRLRWNAENPDYPLD